MFFKNIFITFFVRRVGDAFNVSLQLVTVMQLVFKPFFSTQAAIVVVLVAATPKPSALVSRRTKSPRC